MHRIWNYLLHIRPYDIINYKIRSEIYYHLKIKINNGESLEIIRHHIT